MAETYTLRSDVLIVAHLGVCPDRRGEYERGPPPPRTTETHTLRSDAPTEVHIGIRPEHRGEYERGLPLL